jgi:hypothetical protein
MWTKLGEESGPSIPKAASVFGSCCHDTIFHGCGCSSKKNLCKRSIGGRNKFQELCWGGGKAEVKLVRKVGGSWSWGRDAMSAILLFADLM